MNYNITLWRFYNLCFAALLAFLVSMLTSGLHAATSRDETPNVIIIQSDDQGIDDFSFMHGEGAPLSTPNLDKLAEESVRFEEFYVNPSCAPTRASLLTGKAHLRSGVWGVHGGTDYVGLGQTILPEYFKRAGYATGHIGKWHSGRADGYWPWDRGFDSSYVAELYIFHNNTMLTKEGLYPTEGWVERELADLAIEFIDEHKDEPFFLYYNPITPHNGLYQRNDNSRGGYAVHAPQPLIDKHQSKGLSRGLAGIYAGMEFLDEQIGRILTHLEKLDLKRDTIIIYMSDNGPLRTGAQPLNEKEWSLRNPSLLRGQKAEIWENSIRSQLLIHWPKNSKFSPRRIEGLTDITDIVPTLAEIIGEPLDEPTEIDGISILPAITGTDSSILQNRKIYRTSGRTWLSVNINPSKLNEDLSPDKSVSLFDYKNSGNRVRSQRMVRSGDWKLSLDELFSLTVPKGRQEEVTYRGEDTADITKKLDQKFAKWWRERVLASPHSYTKPVHFIGYYGDKPSVIYPHSVIQYGEGKNIRPWNHFVEGFKKSGDFIKIKVNFKSAGPWVPLLVGHARPIKGNAKFRLYLSSPELGEGPAVEGEISKKTLTNVAQDSLPPNSDILRSPNLQLYAFPPMKVPKKWLDKDVFFNVELLQGVSNSKGVWKKFQEIVFLPESARVAE